MKFPAIRFTVLLTRRIVGRAVCLRARRRLFGSRVGTGPTSGGSGRSTGASAGAESNFVARVPLAGASESGGSGSNRGSKRGPVASMPGVERLSIDLAVKAAEAGIFKKYGVQMIGVNVHASLPGSPGMQSSIVQASLEYARLAGAPANLQTEDVDLTLAAGAVIRSLEDAARSKAHTVRLRATSNLPLVHADPVHVRDILVSVLETRPRRSVLCLALFINSRAEPGIRASEKRSMIWSTSLFWREPGMSGAKRPLLFAITWSTEHPWADAPSGLHNLLATAKSLSSLFRITFQNAKRIHRSEDSPLRSR